MVEMLSEGTSMRKIILSLPSALVALSLGLSLASCADQLDREISAPIVETVDGDDDDAPFVLEATFDSSDPRALVFDLEKRGYGYTNEYQPKIYPPDAFASEVSNRSVDIVVAFVKEGDPNSMQTQILKFEPSRTLNIRGVVNQDTVVSIFAYKGEIKLRGDYSIDDGKWFVMGLLNKDSHAYEDPNTRNPEQPRNSKDIKDIQKVYYGRSWKDGSDNDEAQAYAAGTPLLGYGGGQRGDFKSLPYLSQWQELETKQAQDTTIVNKKQVIKTVIKTRVPRYLRFRPQGVLLQYDMGDNTIDNNEARRYGVISNALTFSGYYDTSKESLYKRFEARGADGISAPEWIEDAPSMAGYKMYARAAEDGLAIGERVYPWNMPVLSYEPAKVADHVSTIGDLQKLGLKELDLSDGDAHVVQSPVLRDGQKGVYNFVVSNGGRRFYTLWGMPRKQVPAQRYTYFFSSSYLASESATEPKGVTLTNKMKEQVPTAQPFLVFYQTDLDFTKDFGKVKHIQSVEVNDLMLTEVYYRERNGKNYAALEINNPTQDYKDLRQYAVARLSPNGNRLSYRRADGSLTDNLSEALILPLAVINPNKQDPFDNEYMRGWTGDRGAYDRKPEPGDHEDFTKQREWDYFIDNDRYHMVFYSWMSAFGNPYRWSSKGFDDRAMNLAFRENRPDVNNFWWFTFTDGEMQNDRFVPNDRVPLHPVQSIILCNTPFLKIKRELATAYVGTHNESLSVDDRTALYLKDEILVVNHNLKGYRNATQGFRYMFAYNDAPRVGGEVVQGNATLDYEPGDAFALIKKHEHGGWQVIDATGPIGEQGVGYSKDYKSFQDQFRNKKNFSWRRTDDISYPFIVPFRTKATALHDWVYATHTNSTLGYRDRADKNVVNSDGYGWRYVLPWSWKRTPLDANYSFYKNHIPEKRFNN